MNIKYEPLVSVIIPCYNHGKYINDTINSILYQTYTNIEIIIVNDGSTDYETINLLNNYHINNLYVIHQDNKKTSSARNTGFANSKGEYILLIDADDLISSTFIEKSMSILNVYPRIGAVSSWTICFGREQYIRLPEGGSIENFVEDINCPVTALVRRQVWEQNGGFDERLTIGYEDWDFWIQTTINGWIVHIIPDFLFYYRQNNSSRAKDAVKNRDDIIKYLRLKYLNIFDKFFK